MELDDLQEAADAVQAAIASVVVGQERIVDHLLIGLLAEGDILLERLPGTTKTLLARAFANALALRFKRVQFTPDLMPGDVTGTNLFDFHHNEFKLTRGPIFTDVLLADEINRTPPKTQAALLQAMQEREVIIDGTTHELGSGFLVVATQDPIEHGDTYPLPEAQLDRFFLKLEVEYPSRQAEIEIAKLHGGASRSAADGLAAIEARLGLDGIPAARSMLRQIELSDSVIEYAVDLVRSTRGHPSLTAGGSPRSITMPCVASRARAATTCSPTTSRPWPARSWLTAWS